MSRRWGGTLSQGSYVRGAEHLYDVIYDGDAYLLLRRILPPAMAHQIKDAFRGPGYRALAFEMKGETRLRIVVRIEDVDWLSETMIPRLCIEVP